MRLAHAASSVSSSLVLADAVVPKGDPAVLGAALGTVLAAIAREEETEDAACARRIFQAAQPLLTLADRPPFRTHVEPSAARVRLVMATLETRSGNLGPARALLEAAAAAEPQVDTLLTLAAIERQSGNVAAALAQVNRAIAVADANHNLAETAETHLAAFEIQRETGSIEKAQPELAASLTAALTARQRATTPPDKAR